MEILDDTSEMLDYQREVGKLIDKLSDPMLKLVMRDLYIDGLTITEVAKRRNYSERRIYSFRDLALEECKKFHTISE
jgi:DNA-directed RNA polymerase specialized sigma24 family protein